MNAMPGFNDVYASANRRRDEATAELQRMREANAMVPDAAAARSCGTHSDQTVTTMNHLTQCTIDNKASC